MNNLKLKSYLQSLDKGLISSSWIIGVFSVESGGDRLSGVARGVFRSMSEMGVRIWFTGGGGSILPSMESVKIINIMPL